MINYSKFNDPQMYCCTPADVLDFPIPIEPAFALRKGEKIVHTQQSFNGARTDELRSMFDCVDIAVIEEIARSKYLTSLQVYELIKMRGMGVKRPRLRNRMLKLMKYRVIQENEIRLLGAKKGIKYYELDFKGYQIAKEQGVVFHMGNRYMSLHKKIESGIEDTPSDVKRMLMGNQIIIGLLLSNAKMQRFGIMETLRLEKEEKVQDGCIIRTAVTVKIDDKSILTYEVVRDTPEAYEKLADKVQRYCLLLQNRGYLEKNHHGDAAYPQLIICGESLEHNKKIVKYLKFKGLWNNRDTLLFTEDLLNVRDSLKSLYEITDNGDICWYCIPSADCSYLEQQRMA